LDKVKNKQQSDRRTAIKNLASNYQALTEDNIKELATAFNLDYETLRNAMDDNKDGTRRLNINELKAKIKYDKLSDAEKASIDEFLATITDNYITAISTASGYVTKGTTKQTDM
jgi:hypothetical protein